MSESPRGRKAVGGGLFAYAGSVLFAVWMFGSALVIGTIGLPLMLGPRRAAFWPARLWAAGLFVALRVLVGIRIDVRGRENLPPGPCLIACKHQAMLDTLVTLTLARDPCIVLKRELIWIPIFGWYCWKVGMIAIDRGGGAQAIRQMVTAGRAALAQGRQLVIYPEGTRRAPGAEPAYKGGVGVLYRELEAACIPVATDCGRVWPAHGMRKHRGLASFEVLSPILPGLSRDAFMQMLETELEGASNALLTKPY